MSQPVDVSKLSPEEKEYYEKYGMLPKKNINQMLHKRIEVPFVLFFCFPFVSHPPTLVSLLFLRPPTLPAVVLFSSLLSISLPCLTPLFFSPTLFPLLFSFLAPLLPVLPSLPFLSSLLSCSPCFFLNLSCYSPPPPPLPLPPKCSLHFPFPSSVLQGKQHFDSADWAKKLSAAKSGEGAPAGAPAPAGARPAALKGKQFSHLN
ncbi:Pleckstriny-like domain family B member 2 [Balamuthia mandrillaris]